MFMCEGMSIYHKVCIRVKQNCISSSLVFKNTLKCH